LGIENARNTSGPNPTAANEIAKLAEDLQVMLVDRRKYGNLGREEFVFVSMMSWLHLTLLFDSPIVRDLKAEARAPWERLATIGDMVDVPAHEHADGYFRMAEPLSHVLMAIESGFFSSPATAPALYLPGAVRDDMMTVLTYWREITGHDLMASKVVLTGSLVGNGTPAGNQPLALPAAGLARLGP
jgi:hypothetical protein